MQLPLEASSPSSKVFLVRRSSGSSVQGLYGASGIASGRKKNPLKQCIHTGRRQNVDYLSMQVETIFLLSIHWLDLLKYKGL